VWHGLAGYLNLVFNNLLREDCSILRRVRANSGGPGLWWKCSTMVFLMAS
jgi:hypothetical protein